jgi:hypothetical protein
VALVRVRLHPLLADVSRSLELLRTADAVVRFGATSPVGEAGPAIAGLDLRGFLDRLARDVGFHNGLADLLPSVAGSLGAKLF